MNIQITLDIALELESLKDYFNLFSEELVTSRAFNFKELDEKLNLSGRSYYLRTKSFPTDSGIKEQELRICIGC